MLRVRVVPQPCLEFNRAARINISPRFFHLLDSRATTIRGPAFEHVNRCWIAFFFLDAVDCFVSHGHQDLSDIIPGRVTYAPAGSWYLEATLSEYALKISLRLDHNTLFYLHDDSFQPR